MSTTWLHSRTPWTARVHRAEELAERNPWSKQVLGFYSLLLAFQKTIYERVTVGPASKSAEFLPSLDLDRAARELPELAEIVSAYGPVTLAKNAARWHGSSFQQNRDLLEQWLFAAEIPDGTGAFFARVLLQPQAERLVELGNFLPQSMAENRCPYCGSRPQLAVLRPEGDGAKRMLLCSLCSSEWAFRRILCPECGEENHEKLPRYSAVGIPAVRVEACETCRHYQKSVDLTLDGLAVPVVDEIAAAPLDLWAAEHDYRKIQANIVGF